VADLKIDSPLVMFRQKYTSSTPTLFGFLNHANVHPHAIALLYSPDGLPSIKLSAEKPFIKITPDIKNLIKDKLVDLVVYGRRASSEQCDIFEEINPNFAGNISTIQFKFSNYFFY